MDDNRKLYLNIVKKLLKTWYSRVVDVRYHHKDETMDEWTQIRVKNRKGLRDIVVQGKLKVPIGTLLKITEYFSGELIELSINDVPIFEREHGARPWGYCLSHLIGKNSICCKCNSGEHWFSLSLRARKAFLDNNPEATYEVLLGKVFYPASLPDPEYWEYKGEVFHKAWYDLQGKRIAYLEIDEQYYTITLITKKCVIPNLVGKMKSLEEMYPNKEGSLGDWEERYIVRQLYNWNCVKNDFTTIVDGWLKQQ